MNDDQLQRQEDRMIALAIQRSMEDQSGAAEEEEVQNSSSEGDSSRHPPHPPLPPPPTSFGESMNEFDGAMPFFDDSSADPSDYSVLASRRSAAREPPAPPGGSLKRKKRRKTKKSRDSTSSDGGGSSGGGKGWDLSCANGSRTSSSEQGSTPKRARTSPSSDPDPDGNGAFSNPTEEDARLAYEAMQDAVREQESGLSRNNDDVIQNLLNNGLLNSLGASAAALEEALHRNASSLTGLSSELTAAAAAEGGHFDDDDDDEGAGDDDNEGEEEGDYNPDGDSNTGANGNDAIDVDASATVTTAMQAEQALNNAPNDTLTIPSDSATEATPPALLRVGGGEVQSSDVQISLVAWENMAQIDRHSPVITTKSDSQAQYLQSLSPTKKLKGKPSDFVFIEKGNIVRFAMGKTEGTMKDLFERYGEVTGLDVKDLTFVHASELPLGFTLEQCCLMKDDIVLVSTRKDRSLEVEEASFVEKSDVAYFRQLRTLMPDIHPGADVVFDCTGKPGDGQRFFSTLVKGHSGIISARCSWLGEKIKGAREVARLQGDGDEEAQEDSVLTTAAVRAVTTTTTITTTVTSLEHHPATAMDQDADETDSLNEDSRGIEVPIVIADEGTGNRPSPPPSILTPRRSSRGGLISNVVEAPVVGGNAGGQEAVVETETSPIIEVNPTPRASSRKMLKISITNHNPEAFKILLEFLYTNRCPTLGENAFMTCAVDKGEPKLTEEDLNQLLPGMGPISVEDENGPGVGGPVFSFDSQNPTTIWHKQGVKVKGSIHPYQGGKWPNNGDPTVTINDVLATLRLAEEAKLPKLSRMCEVAASVLLDNRNVASAIIECGTYREKWGKELTILKKAAMSFLLGDRSNLMVMLGQEAKGQDSKAKGQDQTRFVKALTTEFQDMVPILLEGLDEIMPHQLKFNKPCQTVEESIAEQDSKDRDVRQNERIKNICKRPNMEIPEDKRFMFPTRQIGNIILDRFYLEMDDIENLPDGIILETPPHMGSEAC